jgi:sialidase-1
MRWAISLTLWLLAGSQGVFGGEPGASTPLPEHREWRPLEVPGAARGLSPGASIQDGLLALDGVSEPDVSHFFELEAVGSAMRFEFFIEETGEGAHGCGAIFGSTSSADYLSIHLDRHRQAILVRSAGGERWKEIARRTGLDYRVGEWHQARIAMGEGRILCEIDGQKVLEEKLAVPAGRFGFYASDGRARFRRVVVEGTPARLDPPWERKRVVLPHVVIGADAGPYQAFPDLCLTQSGEMLCVFYAGFGHVSLPGFAPGGKPAPEWARAGRICLSRSRDFGRTWSRSEVVVDTPLDDRDPSIVELGKGELLVTYFSLAAGPGGSGYRFVTSSQVRSMDGGRAWSDPVGLFADWAVSSPARKLSDGRLALPLYYVGEEKSPGKGYGGVSFSSDGGAAWSVPVAVGKEGPLELDAEPDLVELPEGRLLMALRPVLALSSSEDHGRTWSRPEPIGFPGHCPYFLRLRSGIILLAHRLPGTSLHYSLDDGRTWSANVVLDTVGGAYPSLCELPESFPAGTVFAAYYEEGGRSRIRGRRLRATRDGVRLLDPGGE